MLPPRKRDRSPTEFDERMSRRRQRVGNPAMRMNACLIEAMMPSLTVAPRWARILSSPACAEMISVASSCDIVKVRNAIVALAISAMDAESVRLTSLVVYRVASSNEEAAALFAVECVRDALVAMSRHASTSSAVRWVSLALHTVTSRCSDYCVKELFGTAAVRDALVYLSHQATTPCAVEAVSMALSDLTCKGAAHEKAFVRKCVRNGLLSMVGSATTPRSIEQLAKAFDNCIDISRCEKFLCARVRDALLAMCAAATTAECIWQVTFTLVSFGAVRCPLVSRMVTTCEVRDALVLLASRAMTSHCAGSVASTFQVLVREDWVKGPPELFGTSSVHDALVALASRVTEPEDVAACGGAVHLLTWNAQGAVRRELVTPAMRDAVVGLARYATTSNSAYSIKEALLALKPTYRAGSLSRVFAALTKTKTLGNAYRCDSTVIIER